MPDDTNDRVAFDAFSLAIRVICHAWEIDPPATRFEAPWALLREIADGKTTKEVACMLGISVKTAESHRARIMSKLRLKSTADLVKYAIRNGYA